MESVTRLKSTSDLASGAEEPSRFDRQHSAGGIQLPWLPSPAPSPPLSPPLKAKEDPGIGTRPALLVMKFGGSSLAGVEHLRRVAGIVRERLAQRPVLVLSAMGKTTNNLLDAAEQALATGKADISKLRASHEGIFQELGLPVPAQVSDLLAELERIIFGVALLKEVSARTRDLIVSFGERLSVRVFEACFNLEEARDGKPATSGPRIKACALDSWDIGMRTTRGAGSADSAFSQVEVLESSYTSIAAYLGRLTLDYSYLPVVTGYIAQDEQGTITTLGRDGSDLTATVIGAAVRASEVQIWKDVSGILTTDPRTVPAARPVEILTYEEAAELSTFGAKVVHPAAVMPAWLGNVPICVRNSLLPQQPGTRIVASLSEQQARSSRVAALSSKDHITMIVIRSTRMLGQHGFLAQVFQLFNKFEASVDVIATSEVTVSLTLDRGYKTVDLDGLRVELESVAKVDITDNMAMLTLIAAKRDSSSVLRESFEVFEQLGVNIEMVSHGASNVNVTFVLPSSSLTRCTQRLHEVFFER
mmetsp:Transcript_29724/g.91486  ORF Transcript_29724/g.91486 Transcript_29724/m.91486 type:complete len:532 (-) Transcript_29724:87-1682(-)